MTLVTRARHGTQPTGSRPAPFHVRGHRLDAQRRHPPSRGPAGKKGRIPSRKVDGHCLTLHSAGLPRDSRPLAKDPVRPFEAKHRRSIFAQTMNRFSARISLRHQPVLAAPGRRHPGQTPWVYDIQRNQCVTRTLPRRPVGPSAGLAILAPNAIKKARHGMGRVKKARPPSQHSIKTP